jgi:RNA polymerase sigma factor (TIGR02999 family)
MSDRDASSTTPHAAGELTLLLAAARAGEPEALERAIPLVYPELRRLARNQIRRSGAEGALRPTELVHEAYMKLSRARVVDARGREHFLAIAARAMRQLLVDDARRRQAGKRGGAQRLTTLTDGVSARALPPEELLALDRALETLEPRQRQVVEYRFFGGLEEQEIAVVLGVTERTVRRDWVKARAWLYRELYG